MELNPDMKNQVLTLSALSLLGALSAGTVSASDLCDVAEADRQPMDALQSKLESEGWEIRKIKVEDGCYEAYAINNEGQKVEAFFNPQTFELVKSEID
jgi:hypothetical protein